MALDPVRNWAVGTLTAGISSGATTFSVSSGQGTLFPTVATEGAFNAVIWNATDFTDPLSDPNHEIVRVTAIATDAFTVTRAQENTSAVAHNTAAKTYQVAIVPTRKMIQDIDARLSDGLNSYAADTGAANAYIITLAPAPTAYAAGQCFRFKATNANTSASTLNVNGLGAKSIKGNGGASLASGEIQAGQMVTVQYDGTNFQLTSQSLSPSTIQAGTYFYGADTGSANAYAATMSPAPGTYTTGLRVAIKIANTNTGASTLNLNGLGTKNIKTYIGPTLSDPGPGSLTVGTVVELLYDGTQFLIQAGKVTGGENLVASYVCSAASSLAITGLTAGRRYKVVYNLLWNTSTGVLQLRFNNDSGGNYSYAGAAANSGNIAARGADAQTSAALSDPSVGTTAGKPLIGSFEFGAMNGTLTSASFITQAGAYNSVSVSYQGNGFYAGASNVTEADLIASAGTFTGEVLVYLLGG